MDEIKFLMTQYKTNKEKFINVFIQTQLFSYRNILNIF